MYRELEAPTRNKKKTKEKKNKAIRSTYHVLAF